MGVISVRLIEGLSVPAEVLESLLLDIVPDSASAQVAAGRARPGAPEGLETTLIAPAPGEYSAQLRSFDEGLPGLSPQLCRPGILAQAEMVQPGPGSELCPHSFQIIPRAW